MANTTTWVDEKYSKLLAKQLVNELSTAGTVDLLNIEQVRQSILYIAEEKVTYGFGFNKKKGTKVYFFYPHPISSWVTVSYLIYDKRGSIPGRTSSKLAQPMVFFTKHALERLFERLRTNSKQEILEVMGIFCKAPQVMVDCEVKMTIKGVGKFISTGVRDEETKFEAWLIKTFIPEKK